MVHQRNRWIHSVKESSFPLMYHDPDRSWIADPDLDHPKGMHLKSQLQIDWIWWTNLLLSFFVTDHSGHHSLFWNNDTVFPIIPEGFSWPSASSKTVLVHSKESSTFIVALTQPSLTSTKTGSSTFPIASFPTTKELIIATTAVYTSSVADITSSQVKQFATDVNHYPTATKFATGKNPYDDQV